MDHVDTLRAQYRSKWIEHYEESLWSNFSRFPFSVPSEGEEKTKHFIHQLMVHSMFNYFNEQHERQKVLEARLAEAEAKLAQLSDNTGTNGDSLEDVIMVLPVEQATFSPNCDSAAVNDDDKDGIVTDPLETASDQEATPSTNIDRKSRYEESSDSPSSPSLLKQNLFRRPTLVPDQRLKKNKLTTVGKSRSAKNAATPLPSSNYTKSGWIKPGAVKLKPTIKSYFIQVDSSAVQLTEKRNVDLSTDITARNKYTSSSPRTVSGIKRKSDELFSSSPSSPSDMGHVSSSGDEIVEIKVEKDYSEELSFMDYEVDDDVNATFAEQQEDEEPPYPVTAIKEEPIEADQNNDDLPATSQSHKPVAEAITTTTTFDDAPLGEDTLNMLETFDKLPRSNGIVPTFKYKPDKAVRKKDERAKLPAFACDMCREYYEGQNLSPGEVQTLLQKCSKHRAQYEARTDTPPDFWRTDFPTTQECIQKGYLNIEIRDPNIDPKLRNRI